VSFFFYKLENFFLKKIYLIWLNYILLFFIYNKNYFINNNNFFFLIKYSKNIIFFFKFQKYFLNIFENQYNEYFLKKILLIFNYKKQIKFYSILNKKPWFLLYYNIYFLKNILLKMTFLVNFKNYLIIKKLNYFIFLKNTIQNLNIVKFFQKSININEVLFNLLKFSENKFLVLFNCLNFTIFLGLFFERIQWYEYAHASFSISDGVYGTVFFLLTGLHGFHVMVGIFLLFYCWLRFYKKDFLNTLRPHVGVSTSIWYWHFVDIVWLFVFFFVYLWSY